MSDDPSRRVVARFNGELKTAWTVVRPSLTAVESLSRKLGGQPDRLLVGRVQTLSASTTHDILNGARRKLPRWAWVASFITVLHELAAEQQIGLDRIGTIEEWRAKHEAAWAEYEAEKARLRHRQQTAAEVVRPTFEGVLRRQLPGPLSGETGGPVYEPPPPRPSSEEEEEARRIGLLALAKRSGKRAWWYDRKEYVPSEVRAYLTLERAASQIRCYEPWHVPALLQTEEYARAIARLRVPDASVEQLDTVAELLARRQQILHGPNPARLWVILDEAVLTREVGPAVLRAQVEHLIELCSLPHLTIQLKDADRDQAMVGGPLAMLRFPEEDLPDLLFLAQHGGGLFPGLSADVHQDSRVWHSLSLVTARKDTMTALRRARDARQ